MVENLKPYKDHLQPRRTKYRDNQIYKGHSFWKKLAFLPTSFYLNLSPHIQHWLPLYKSHSWGECIAPLLVNNIYTFYRTVRLFTVLITLPVTLKRCTLKISHHLCIYSAKFKFPGWNSVSFFPHSVRVGYSNLL